MVDEPIDYDDGTPDQRAAVLDVLLERAAALHAEILRVVAAADRCDDFEADGEHSMTDWLAYRYALPHPSARQWVRAAHALETMPLVQAQYAAGAIGFDQLVAALSFATPADDERLAELLPELSYAQVEAMAKARRRIKTRDHDEARQRTHVRIRPDRSGLGSRLSGFLPTEDAAYVEIALTRRAEATGPEPETGTWTPHDARMAGALRDLCAEDLAAAAADSSAPDASIVVVHVPADTIGQHDDPHADGDARTARPGNATIGGDPIGCDALHRLLCDTRIEFSIDEPDGRTIGIGRATRTIPRWLRRRVLAREHGCCRWPGCNRPIRHLHHVRHWSEGGPTNASNLMGVCWHHHHLLHEGGWHATGNADTSLTLTSPYARTIHSRAGPAAA
jgi:hypothetical protein